MNIFVDQDNYKEVNLRLTKKLLTSEHYQFLLGFKGEKLDITISITPQSLVKLRDDINELIFMFSD
ncbi:hypothetical protein [Bacillus halotolerans]|uniref:hypothetical protein n=1 Tax=Bacillus halotolerans TaxID=260554 RepID=UPI0020C5AD9E|nr:hypothetical protein [Bacillus halotolerans]UTL74848.1 hypothetical protein NLW79_11380 [Bacillus halotolerans]